MIIRNLDKKYVVTREWGQGQFVAQYVCYEPKAQKHAQFRAARQRLADVNGTEIGFLTEQIHNQNFTDFIDFFTEGDFLYVLTQYPVKGIPLKEKLSREICSLEERLEIVKHMLERLILLQMPPYFFYSCMDIDMIYVQKTDDVLFDYNMEDIYRFSQFDFKAGEKRLSDVLSFCFKDEERLCTMPELDTLLYQLSQGDISDVLGIYHEYWKIFQKYFGKKEEDLEPKSFWFRLWEKLKKIGRLIKKLIYPVLLLLALAYLIASIQSFIAEPEYHQNFDRIGNLTEFLESPVS